MTEAIAEERGGRAADREKTGAGRAPGVAEAATDLNTLVRMRVTGLTIHADNAGEFLVATLAIPIPNGKGHVQDMWSLAGGESIETFRVHVPAGVDVRIGDEFVLVRLPPDDANGEGTG